MAKVKVNVCVCALGTTVKNFLGMPLCLFSSTALSLSNTPSTCVLYENVTAYFHSESKFNLQSESV